jgi:hypothetical protein
VQRRHRPALIEEYTGTAFVSRNAVMSSISTDAAYRSAYILLGSGTERDELHARHSGQFCPEPPPDVAQSISAAFSAALEGKLTVPQGQTGGQASAQVARALATAVEPLVKRSQGLQFFRDQTFYTCVAFLNGALDEAAYREQLVGTARLAAALIALEVSADPKLSQVDTNKAEADLTKALAMLDTIEKKVATMRPQ